MIDREHKLPIKRQAEVLSISRGTAYYKPRPVSERDLLLMRKLDELHLNYPFAGSRMLRGLLHQQGVDAVEEALSKYRRPEIFNTDQGSQFTSEAFTERLRKNEIQISMDGKGCWRDNVFVERIWRTIKYEEVYLRAYESVQEAKTSLSKYIEFYNQTRPHSSLKGKTPNQVHLNRPPEHMAA
jgi:hypothetical protein